MNNSIINKSIETRDVIPPVNNETRSINKELVETLQKKRNMDYTLNNEILDTYLDIIFLKYLVDLKNINGIPIESDEINEFRKPNNIVDYIRTPNGEVKKLYYKINGILSDGTVDYWVDKKPNVKKKYKFFTSDNLIQAYASKEQILSIHHNKFDLSIIYNLNNDKSGNFKKLSKIKVESILRHYNINYEGIKITFLKNSFFVGISRENKKINPIFMKKDGWFNDIKGKNYWPTYKKTIDRDKILYEFLSCADKFCLNINYNHYDKDEFNTIIQKFDSKNRDCNWWSKCYNIMELINEHFFDYKLLLNINKNKNEVYNEEYKEKNNKENTDTSLFIFAGKTEYARNKVQTKVYLNESGKIVDLSGNTNYWPYYETTYDYEYNEIIYLFFKTDPFNDNLFYNVFIQYNKNFNYNMILKLIVSGVAAGGSIIYNYESGGQLTDLIGDVIQSPGVQDVTNAVGTVGSDVAGVASGIGNEMYHDAHLISNATNLTGIESEIGKGATEIGNEIGSGFTKTGQVVGSLLLDGVKYTEYGLQQFDNYIDTIFLGEPQIVQPPFIVNPFSPEESIKIFDHLKHQLYDYKHDESLEKKLKAEIKKEEAELKNSDVGTDNTNIADLNKEITKNINENDILKGKISDDSTRITTIENSNPGLKDHSIKYYENLIKNNEKGNYIHGKNVSNKTMLEYLEGMKTTNSENTENMLNQCFTNYLNENIGSVFGLEYDFSFLFKTCPNLTPAQTATLTNFQTYLSNEYNSGTTESFGTLITTFSDNNAVSNINNAINHIISENSNILHYEHDISQLKEIHHLKDEEKEYGEEIAKNTKKDTYDSNKILYDEKQLQKDQGEMDNTRSLIGTQEKELGKLEKFTNKGKLTNEAYDTYMKELNESIKYENEVNKLNQYIVELNEVWAVDAKLSLLFDENDVRFTDDYIKQLIKVNFKQALKRGLSQITMKTKPIMIEKRSIEYEKYMKKYMKKYINSIFYIFFKKRNDFIEDVGRYFENILVSYKKIVKNDFFFSYYNEKKRLLKEKIEGLIKETPFKNTNELWEAIIKNLNMIEFENDIIEYFNKNNKPDRNEINILIKKVKDNYELMQEKQGLEKEIKEENSKDVSQ